MSEQDRIAIMNIKAKAAQARIMARRDYETEEDGGDHGPVAQVAYSVADRTEIPGMTR